MAMESREPVLQQRVCQTPRISNSRSNTRHICNQNNSGGQNAASSSQFGMDSGPKRKTYVARKNVLSVPGQKSKGWECTHLLEGRDMNHHTALCEGFQG